MIFLINGIPSKESFLPRSFYFPIRRFVASVSKILSTLCIPSEGNYIDTKTHALIGTKLGYSRVYTQVPPPGNLARARPHIFLCLKLVFWSMVVDQIIEWPLEKVKISYCGNATFSRRKLSLNKVSMHAV